MKRKIIFLFAVSLIIVSCGVFTTVGDKVKNVELGMTKKETVGILGKDYDLIGASVTPQGSLEKIAYLASSDSIKKTQYIFVFIDDKLTEYYKDEQYNSAALKRPVKGRR